MAQTPDSGLNGTPSALRRRNFLQLLGGAAAAGIAGPALAACSSSSGTKTSSAPAGGGKKTITIMTSIAAQNPKLVPMWQQVVADPLKLTIKIVNVDDAQLPAQVAAAQQSGNPPDLVWWSAQGVPGVLAGGTKLVPLNSYVNGLPDKGAAFYQQDLEAGKVNGQIYSLGIGIDARGIVYRDDYVSAAGLTVPPSWTTDQFGQWTAKLTPKLKSPGRYGFGFEAKVGDGRFSATFLPLVWSTGTPFVVQDGGKWKIGFQHEQMQQVMQFLSNTVHVWHSVPSEAANWGYADTDGNYAKGVLGSYTAGPFVKGTAAQYPNTLAHTKVAPMPYISKQTTSFGEWAVMIPQNAPDHEKSWSFVEGIRNEQAQTAMVAQDTCTLLSVRKSVNPGIKDPILAGFAPFLETSTVFELIDINPIMTTAIFPAIDSMLLQNTSPADATAALMKNMNTALAQINGS